ncbi:MAG: MFS transporter [Propionibacteriaceae bacterium]|nr:MFS transporter [Propionibacteriaceae bacterium]
MTDIGPLRSKRFLVAAYGPTTLSSVGHGAVFPLVSLSALDLGASVEHSAFIVGLLAVGQLLGDLPASYIATRLGDKWALTLACGWDAVFMAIAFLAGSWWRSLPVLTLAVFAIGLSGSVFGLARQSYLTAATPVHVRARALSTLGGVFRIGFFVGPLIGAGVIHASGLAAAYIFASGMSVFAGLVTLLLPDLPRTTEVVDGTEKVAEPKLFAVLRAHVHTYLVLGTGVLVLALARQVRQVILPLWCESLGMEAHLTSLVFSFSMVFDMSLFYLGGKVMDRFGRMWVAVPSTLLLGVGLLLLPLTSSLVGVLVVAFILGVGNGIGSGLVMTLGSDSSPDYGRTQFLSGWRLMSDLGNLLGPLAISALTAISSLALACLGTGALTVAGAAWLGCGIKKMPALKERTKKSLREL